MNEGRIDALCEAVADIAYNAGSDGFKIEDSRAMMAKFIHWAYEFEALNKDRDWDGEYIEEIDEFYMKKKRECLIGS